MKVVEKFKGNKTKFKENKKITKLQSRVGSTKIGLKTPGKIKGKKKSRKKKSRNFQSWVWVRVEGDKVGKLAPHDENLLIIHCLSVFCFKTSFYSNI